MAGFRVIASCRRCSRTTAYLWLSSGVMQETEVEDLAGRLFQHMVSVHSIAENDAASWAEATEQAAAAEVEQHDLPQQQQQQPAPQPPQHRTPQQQPQRQQLQQPQQPQQPQLWSPEATHIMMGILRDISRNLLFILQVLEERLNALPPRHPTPPPRRGNGHSSRSRSRSPRLRSRSIGRRPGR